MLSLPIQVVHIDLGAKVEFLHRNKHTHLHSASGLQELLQEPTSDNIMEGFVPVLGLSFQSSFLKTLI